jgi:hypothetical protein
MVSGAGVSDIIIHISHRTSFRSIRSRDTPELGRRIRIQNERRHLLYVPPILIEASRSRRNSACYPSYTNESADRLAEEIARGLTLIHLYSLDSTPSSSSTVTPQSTTSSSTSLIALPSAPYDPAKMNQLIGWQRKSPGD